VLADGLKNRDRNQEEGNNFNCTTLTARLRGPVFKNEGQIGRDFEAGECQLRCRIAEEIEGLFLDSRIRNSKITS
jgi:hypothetical protein